MLYDSEQIAISRDSEQMISSARVKVILNEHDCSDGESFNDFYNELGVKKEYLLGEILNWLGY